MKKKGIHKAREVFKIKNQILKLVPYATDIDVKIDQSTSGKYKSQIKVHIPPRQRLIVEKKSERLAESLERSKDAILKQVKKIKEKREPKLLQAYALRALH